MLSPFYVKPSCFSYNAIKPWCPGCCLMDRKMKFQQGKIGRKRNGWYTLNHRVAVSLNYTAHIYLKDVFLPRIHPSRRAPTMPEHTLHLWDCWLKRSCAQPSRASLKGALTNAQCLRQLLIMRANLWREDASMCFLCVHLFACYCEHTSVYIYLNLLMWLCAYLCLCVCAHTRLNVCLSTPVTVLVRLWSRWNGTWTFCHWAEFTETGSALALQSSI